MSPTTTRLRWLAEMPYPRRPANTLRPPDTQPALQTVYDRWNASPAGYIAPLGLAGGAAIVTASLGAFFGLAAAICFLLVLFIFVGTVAYFDAHPPKDKRTLAEKNWDWIMGPELPTTCSVAGHSYVIDPHECDWCHAERWVEFVQHEDYVAAEVKAVAQRYQIMGQPEPLWIAPARIAGKYIDGWPSAVRSSEYEARQQAKAQAERAAKRDAAERRYEARRHTRPPSPKPKSYATGSYPRGSDLKMEVAHLKNLRELGLISEGELRGGLKNLMDERFER